MTPTETKDNRLTTADLAGQKVDVPRKDAQAVRQTTDGAQKSDTAQQDANGAREAARPVNANAEMSERDPARTPPDASTAAPLFGENDAQQFRAHWGEIQTGFVDEPRRSVEQADNLVAQAIQRLATIFANERSRLEDQWSRGDDVDTEDLRVALQRYRSFFDRLLSI